MKKSLFICILLFLFYSCSDEVQFNEAQPTYSPLMEPSHTIPVIYINTENGQSIIDKVTQIPANFYLDSESSDYDYIGSIESPVDLTIRGRGNSTWEQEKKCYKLKFSEKIAICGMPKSKHWALMAHIFSNTHIWLDNEMAFEMARVIGMSWAPHSVPVEFVLNGEYMGVYFLTETVRIEKNRLSIFEQEDEETDPEIIPYGWLLEIDNWGGDMALTSKDDETLYFTFHTPEELSGAQWDFISNEVAAIMSTIYDDANPDKWADFIDSKSLAQYFIIREILHDSDGYTGSCYLYKDKEDNAKWKFGPLWDCTVQSTAKENYIAYSFLNQTYMKRGWIKRLMSSPIFEEALREEWSVFYNPENFQRIKDHLYSYTQDLDLALEQSNKRWENTTVGLYDKDKDLSTVLKALENNAYWIDSHLNINEIVRLNETKSLN